MKSVGEAMAIGRTFQESLQKALRSLEIGIMGLDPLIEADTEEIELVLSKELRIPSSNRIRYIGDAFRAGFQIEKIFELTGIDIWFLHQIQDIVH